MAFLKNKLSNLFNLKGFLIFKYLGPGILVTVGFIDPGNWAANLAAGSIYGYQLLWVITISTIMLIILQHNAAHLGIATGYCLAENTYKHLKPRYSKIILSTGFMASISTAVAEVLGGAIAVNMLMGINIKISAILIFFIVLFIIMFNTYHKLEKLIIAFVAIIGFCFLYETTLFDISWLEVAKASVIPSIPEGSMYLIVGALGAVVMPHNLFLHSEIIQTRKWELTTVGAKNKLLKYEFIDTLFSMILGWVINCTIIIIAAEVFFKNNIIVEELSEAADLLKPLLGSKAAIVFAVALLFAGVSSSITAGMSGGTIFSGILHKEYNEKSNTTKIGVISTIFIATIVILFINNPLKGLIYSQVLLSFQLPITIFLQLYLTGSKKVMGQFVNKPFTNILLFFCAGFVTILNIVLLVSLW
jgi:manganese transport protein